MSKKLCNFAAQNMSTMKKTILNVCLAFLLTLSLATSFAGCKGHPYAGERIAMSQPIMPIRMIGDTMHVVLTDYVPALYGDTDLWQGLQWTTGEAVECLNMTGTPQVLREMDIVNRDKSIHALTFHDQSGSFAIPILPAKPVRQALISLGYADNKLRVGFYDEVSNPSLEAYIQNTLIDHSLWQAEEVRAARWAASI
jgi:hypothetical protein